MFQSKTVKIFTLLILIIKNVWRNNTKIPENMQMLNSLLLFLLFVSTRASHLTPRTWDLPQSPSQAGVFVVRGIMQLLSNMQLAAICVCAEKIIHKIKYKDYLHLNVFNVDIMFFSSALNTIKYCSKWEDLTKGITSKSYNIKYQQKVSLHLIVSVFNLPLQWKSSCL